MITLYNVEEEDVNCLIKLLLDTIMDLKSQLNHKTLECNCWELEYDNEVEYQKSKKKKKARKGAKRE